MNQYDGQQGSSADTNGYTSNDSESRSPLSNLNFLRNMTTSEKKQTKGNLTAIMSRLDSNHVPIDGQPQKRRGPKPDSKPALTRRQELNRQAQRTHRERKEQYIKALEHELLRVKDLYGASAREKDQAVAEVARLKDILARHGIHYESPASSYNASMPSYTGSTAGSVSGAYRQDSNTSAGMSPPPPMSSHMTTPPGLHGQPMQMSRGGIDYDQLGIDFVLEYDSRGRPIHGRPAYPSPPPGQ
ncbi:hypothetical protein MBLNU457_g0810t2 [Dothideomycetes sp. NU457]